MACMLALHAYGLYNTREVRLVFVRPICNILTVCTVDTQLSLRACLAPDSPHGLQ